MKLSILHRLVATNGPQAKFSTRKLQRKGRYEVYWMNNCCNWTGSAVVRFSKHISRMIVGFFKHQAFSAGAWLSLIKGIGCPFKIAKRCRCFVVENQVKTAAYKKRVISRHAFSCFRCDANFGTGLWNIGNKSLCILCLYFYTVVWQLKLKRLCMFWISNLYSTL